MIKKAIKKINIFIRNKSIELFIWIYQLINRKNFGLPIYKEHKFSNTDYGSAQKNVKISAYFEGKEEYTKNDYHGNCDGCFFNNCSV